MALEIRATEDTEMQLKLPLLYNRVTEDSRLGVSVEQLFYKLFGRKSRLA